MQLRPLAASGLVVVLAAWLAVALAAPDGLAHEEGPTPSPPGPGAESHGRIPCAEGFVDVGLFRFPCHDVDLLAWDSLIGLPSFANDLWGWTDPLTGREYVIVGLFGGAAFVDLGDPEHPVHLGTLPSAASSSFWADVKVYADHAYVVKDFAGEHGLQVFDLTQLRDVTQPPVTFEATAHYRGFGPAHNLAINEETGFLYALGSDTCSGGLHMLDLADPADPTFAGCFSSQGRLHDAQCVVYRGEDADHQGREVCFAADPSGIDSLDVIDVDDKQAPALIAKTPYLERLEALGYAHQGWLTEDHRYFLMGDEADEEDAGHGTRTYVFDVADLDDPRLVGFHEGALPSTDHNLYVRGRHVFESNYSAGLRILRMGDLAALELEEIGFFDSFPADDRVGTQFGPWSVYPYFESGIVVVSDILLGLFVLQPRVLEVVPVPVEIRPAALQPNSRGVTPVALFGSEELPVEDIDPDSLAFGPAAAPVAHRNGPHRANLNGDALADWVVHFRTAEAGIADGDEVACLTGETLEGVPFEGCDTLRTRALE